MKKKIVVTGASGFIGRELVRQLLLREQDTTITILTRRPLDEFKGCEQIICRLEDPTTYASALQGVTSVVHLAANATFGNKIDYQRENVVPTEAFLSAIKSARTEALQNFIYVSTIGAVDRPAFDSLSKPIDSKTRPNPRSKYGQSKLAGEVRVQESGLPWTIVRPTWVYGEGMRAGSHVAVFAEWVASRNWITRLRFPGKVSLIHVTDLARALACAATREVGQSRTYFAETETLSLGQIFSTLAEATHGKAPAQLPIPGLNRLLRPFHVWLPLPLVNLVSDYLVARDPSFVQDFKLDSTTSWRNGLRSVVENLPRTRGAILITGANSGIGFALAQALQGGTHPLILVDQNTSRLTGFTEPHRVIRADLSSSQAIDLLTREIANNRFRAVINNAGVGFKGAFNESPLAQDQLTIAVNVLAPLELTKRLLPALRRDRATILNVASSVAYNPLPGMAVYAASKAFLLSWSLALGAELDLPVLTYSPSGTRTGFQTTAGVKADSSQGLLSPESVAQDMIQRLALNRGGSRLNGLKSKILIHASRLLPDVWRAKLWGFLFAQAR